MSQGNEIKKSHIYNHITAIIIIIIIIIMKSGMKLACCYCHYAIGMIRPQSARMHSNQIKWNDCNVVNQW